MGNSCICILHRTPSLFYFSPHTGLWIFVSLLAGLFLLIHVLTTKIFPDFWISLTLVLIDEALIFIFVICISECHSALENWKREREKIIRDAVRPSTSRRLTTHAVSLVLSEEDISHQNLDSGNILIHYTYIIIKNCCIVTKLVCLKWV